MKILLKTIILQIIIYALYSSALFLIFNLVMPGVTKVLCVLIISACFLKISFNDYQIRKMSGDIQEMLRMKLGCVLGLSGSIAAILVFEHDPLLAVLIFLSCFILGPLSISDSTYGILGKIGDVYNNKRCPICMKLLNRVNSEKTEFNILPSTVQSPTMQSFFELFSCSRCSISFIEAEINSGIPFPGSLWSDSIELKENN